MKKQNVLSDFKEFISIPSVSADPKRLKEIVEAAEFLSGKLKSFGVNAHMVGGGKSPPLVLGRLDSNSPKAKTIAIYGHYDVQPEDPIGEWKTPPFKLTLKNGRFFGRGVSDNKGPIIQNISAIANLAEEGKLSNNIIFLFEGEEESGGSNFEKFVLQAREELSKADCFYVTDVEMFDKYTPQITTSLRGLAYFELTLQTAKADMHSGTWGNLVINPAQVLSELFAKMKSSKTGEIAIPGFYKNIRKISPKESKLLERSWDYEKKLQDSQSYILTPCDKSRPYLSNNAHPSMDINGIISGHTRSGAKTIIPKSAMAKFSFRLVEYQDPKRIESLVNKFIEKELPRGVEYELKMLGGCSPFYASLENPYIMKTASCLKESFGKEPVFAREGASIPAAEILHRVFKKTVILTGFVNPDCNMHAPNENLEEQCFWKGISALEKVYSQE